MSLSTLPPPRAFTVVAIVLGLVLVCTAGLKMIGGTNQVMRVAIPLLSPRLYAAGVVFELMLGIWLLTRIAPVWSWATAIVFFAGLAYLSFSLGWLGQASCGCLGKKVQLSPWWAFGFDIAALVALLAWRPRAFLLSLRDGMPILGGATALVAMSFGALVFWYGTADAAIANLRGEPISINPAVVRLGKGKLDEVKSVEIRLTNYSELPVRIISATSDCSCIGVSGLPIEVPPKEDRVIPIQVRFVGSPGAFRKQFTLLATDERTHVMPVTVTGRLTR